MRVALIFALCAAMGASFAPAARAAPLLTLEYRIDTLVQALQFMGDGSVRVVCDGSVLIACDGSVLNASFRSVNGSVQELTPLQLLGDGSVRIGDGSVTPSDDVIGLDALSFSPNPFLAFSFSVIDAGAPSTFIATFSGPLNLGTNALDFELTGDATLTDANPNDPPADVSMGAIQLTGFGDALVFGAVDYGSVAEVLLPTLGSSGLDGVGAYDLGSASGTRSCSTCTSQMLGIGFDGSGGGDQFLVTARLDLSAATAVPAPAPLALLALGVLGMTAGRRRRTG